MAENGSASSRRTCTLSSLLSSNNSYKIFKKHSDETRNPRTSSVVKCTICGSIFTVGYQGKLALDRHLNTTKHSAAIQQASSSKSIEKLFSKNINKQRANALAEATLTFHNVKHHHSFNSADCANSLYEKTFPDSNIASNIACGRTKTTAIVKGVLRDFSMEPYLRDLQEIPFLSAGTDGSTHHSKLTFPVMVQYFKMDTGIKHFLLNFETLTDEKSATISSFIIKSLESKSLESKAIGLSGDNTNGNFGGREQNGRNNVLAHLEESLGRKLFGVGCPAHVVNNAVHYSFEGFPVDIENKIYKIYDFFNKSPQRIESLKEFSEFTETEYKKMLFFSRTRWLTLFPATDRILSMYDALKSFFASQDPSKSSVVLINFFKDPKNEAMLWFVHSFMSAFHNKIKAIEAERNSILETVSILRNLEDVLLQRKVNEFVPMKVLQILRAHPEIDAVRMKQMMFNAYDRGFEYLREWTQPYEKFDVFQWLSFDSVPQWSSVSKCLSFFLENNLLEIDEGTLFDQFQNVVHFFEKQRENPEFKSKLLCDKWVDYFSSVDVGKYNVKYFILQLSE